MPTPASIADLAGGTCTSQSGTIWYDSCLPQIENTNLLAPADSAPAMIMQLQTGAVDYRLHRYAHRSGRRRQG